MTREATIEGGPLDGRVVKVTAPRLRCASEPIVRYVVIDGHRYPVWTEHEWRLDRDVYRYEGVRA
jgi:hypothetical protein